jgi:ABC-type sugar transport system substrate-binding protein
LPATLAGRELACIVAFDAEAAEYVLKASATQTKTERVPIVAFDSNGAIFDAIDDGRVCGAIFDDPYRIGFAAIRRLSAYSRANRAGLPMPGHGSEFLFSEVVRKENLADFRRRTSVVSATPDRVAMLPADGPGIAGVDL